MRTWNRFEDIDSLNIELIEWLKEKIKVTVSAIEKDTQGYNTYISKNILYTKRVGRIIRSHTGIQLKKCD
jgi:hypothetical protein